jgi:hypothetical protein
MYWTDARENQVHDDSNHSNYPNDLVIVSPIIAEDDGKDDSAEIASSTSETRHNSYGTARKQLYS